MARDDKGRFIKEGAAKARTYKESLEDMVKSGQVLDGLFQKLAERGAMMKEATEGTKDNFEDQVDIAKDLLENTKNIFNVDLKGRDLSKDIAQAKADGREEDELVLISLNEQIKKQKILQDTANKQKEETNEKLSKAQSFLEVIPGIGGSLSDALGKAGKVYEDTLGEYLADGPMEFKALGTAAKGAGLAIAAYIGKNLFESMQGMGAGLMDILSRPEFIFFGAESRAIADEFGNMNESSLTLGLNMKMMSIFSGVTAENQAKIMGMMAATSDLSLEALHSQMASYKQAGVPFKAIMEDVAGNTEFFAKFSKDGGANIFDAAKRAKELGINLSDVSSISSSLLDFESSIENQMKAQVLLGRNLNLDKARQLAFTGDNVGLQDEILRQVGSEAEFNKMNYLQREALAGAIGLSVERLGALVRVEKEGNEAAEKKFKSFVAIGATVLGIAGALLAIIPGMGWAKLGQMALGGVKGAAIGGTIGAAAYKYSTSVPELAEGGIVNTPTLAMVGEQGKEAVVPLGAQGVNVDMKETNQLLRALLGSSEKQVNRLGDIGTA